MAFSGRTMDLAKLLGARPQTPTATTAANGVFKFAASGASNVAAKQRTRTLESRSRQVDTKSLSKAAKKTDRRQEAKVRQANRKDAGLLARRHIDISDEDSDEDPAAAKPARAFANNGPRVDRMERLRKFKEERKKKKEEERAAKKEPFRVGVYKLPSSIPASMNDTTKLGKSSNATFTSSTRQAVAANRGKAAFKAVVAKKNATPSTTFTTEKSPEPTIALPSATTSTPTLIEDTPPDEANSATAVNSESATTEAPLVSLTTATPVRTGQRKSARRSTMFVSPPPASSSIFADTLASGRDLMSFGSPMPRSAKKGAALSAIPAVADAVESAAADSTDGVGAFLDEGVAAGGASPALAATPATAERGRRRTRRQTECQALLQEARRVSPLAPSCYQAEVVTPSGELKTVRRSTRNWGQSPAPRGERHTPIKATPKANRAHPSPYATPKRSHVSELAKSQPLPSEDEILFKTPTQGARSARVKSSLKEIYLQRGSSSDRRRKLAGKPLAAGHLVDLDLTDVPDDPDSPLHDKIRKELEQGRDPEDVLKEVALEMSLNEPSTSDAQGGSSDVKDAAFFKNLLQTETNNLRGKCDLWEPKLESVSHSEFAEGEIRSAIGMTAILLNRKGRFEQFGDLINKFEFNLGDNKITSVDLQGFWDMIEHQVKDAKQKFVRLEELELNGWAEPKKENVAPGRVKPKGLQVAKPKAKASSSLRQMMEEKRRLLAGGGPKNANALAPVSDDQEKVFDAGFFTVRSPLRSKNNSPIIN